MAKKALLTSKEFLRLHQVSFLGAIDMVQEVRYSGSRAEHSIKVAGMAKLYAEFHKEDPELFLVAGLLHDIGHFPFSHSFEKSVGKNLGFDHHLLGAELIRERFGNLLKRFGGAQIVIDLIDLHPVFNGEISVDRIEGTFRCIRAFEIETDLREENVLEGWLHWKEKPLREFFMVRKKVLEKIEEFSWADRAAERWAREKRIQITDLELTDREIQEKYGRLDIYRDT